MEVGQSVEEMKARAEEMARYYCKGFVTALHLVVQDTEHYLDKLNPKYREKAQEGFIRVVGFYDGIPFEELPADEDFSPLLVVRELLPRFKESLDWTLHGENEEINLRAMSDLAIAIKFVGQVYDLRLEKLVREIRKDPGQKGFTIEFSDLYGNRFDFGRTQLN